ncbi:hypothetical protein MSAN_02165900 [Mycena sanguinolenta]|uniref:F-box domain-containing protein n=1 Tax=Mycena sanguinolenta TaxID=230812 RepID=A0A8H6XFN2_9AGAR|nr:hypothetical protein MSAN_02165900 [Mycena sanguinolenta]
MTTLLTLPSEITIKIFTTLIVDLGHAPRAPVVLDLAAICKSLRELVINSPTLWSRIRLRFFPLDMNAIPPCPPKSSRATTFRVGASWPSVLLPDERPECNGDHSLLLSGASDSLRTLTMRGCVGCLASFPNLTKLNIFQLSCSYEEFSHLIKGSQNLITLILGELQDHIPESDAAISLRPLIEAPSIRHFAVGFANLLFPLSDVQPLPLSYLWMPNLEYLEVVGSRADYGELSGKPFPSLKTLNLRVMSFPVSNAALYRSFAKITTLELDNIGGGELLAAPDENEKIPWPHLQTLRCRFRHTEAAWIEKLLENRPHLTVEVPLENKDEVSAMSGTHDVRVLSDESGLISTEDFQRADWEEEAEENWEDSDFSDQVDYMDDDNWDLDQFDGEYYGMEEVEYNEDEEYEYSDGEVWF